MYRSLAVTSTSPEDTRILGAALAPVLLPGDVISLSGDLGAGKTVLVQGLAAALSVKGRVTSPTFTIVHEYHGRYRILHIDVYRLNSFQEVLDLGFEELLDPEAIMLVEWGEAVAPLLPQKYLEIDIRRSVDPNAVSHRDMVFRPRGEDWVRKLEDMRKAAEPLLDAASDRAPGAERFTYAATRMARDHRGWPA
jgi:tRNA threonylcarbamoyladenosine biosynthesis protein TsaE